jgi:hypothetical protein
VPLLASDRNEKPGLARAAEGRCRSSSSSSSSSCVMSAVGNVPPPLGGSTCFLAASCLREARDCKVQSAGAGLAQYFTLPRVMCVISAVRRPPARRPRLRLRLPVPVAVTAARCPLCTAYDPAGPVSALVLGLGNTKCETRAPRRCRCRSLARRRQPVFTSAWLLAAPAASRNSAALPGLEPNCQFQKRVNEIPIFFFALRLLSAVGAALSASDNRSTYSHVFFRGCAS